MDVCFGLDYLERDYYAGLLTLIMSKRRPLQVLTNSDMISIHSKHFSKGNPPFYQSKRRLKFSGKCFAYLFRP